MTVECAIGDCAVNSCVINYPADDTGPAVLLFVWLVAVDSNLPYTAVFVDELYESGMPDTLLVAMAQLLETVSATGDKARDDTARHSAIEPADVLCQQEYG